MLTYKIDEFTPPCFTVGFFEIDDPETIDPSPESLVRKSVEITDGCITSLTELTTHEVLAPIRLELATVYFDGCFMACLYSFY